MDTGTLPCVLSIKKRRGWPFQGCYGLLFMRDAANKTGVQKTEASGFAEKILDFTQLLIRHWPDNLGVVLKKTNERLVSAELKGGVHVVVKATMLDEPFLFRPDNTAKRTRF